MVTACYLVVTTGCCSLPGGYARYHLLLLVPTFSMNAYKSVLLNLKILCLSTLLIISTVLKTFFKNSIQRIKKKISYIITFRMLFVYIVLAMSIVPTCAPNKHVRNERGNRKGLLPNNRKL